MRFTTAVVPTCNDATSIVTTLEHLHASPLIRDIFVIDAASTDGTPSLVAEFRNSHKARVHLLVRGVRVPRDVLARAGYELALCIGAERIVQILPAAASPIETLWRMETLLDEGVQLAIASSHCAGDSLPTSLLSIGTLEELARSFASMMWDAKLVDQVLDGGIGDTSAQTEMVIAALRCGGRVRDVPASSAASAASIRLAGLHRREGLAVWQSRHAAEHHTVLG
ncbi:MAG TPA: glycosyltransferase [Jatrophihabitans sp.]|jgi:hypothetical protein